MKECCFNCDHRVSGCNRYVPVIHHCMYWSINLGVKEEDLKHHTCEAFERRGQVQ